jgi:hypothetical protein
MANLFTCIERQLIEMLYAFPVGEFPVQSMFIKEMPEFDHTLKSMDRLGGTLEHLEKEHKNQFAWFKAKAKVKLPPHQYKMLAFVKLLIQMFNYGLLDHIRNFQGVHEKIYIRHRMMDDLHVRTNEIFSIQSQNSH